MPLYIVEASELGSTPEGIGRVLVQTFKACVRWNAVVLIENLDMFLERRAINDVERSNIVAVFVRQLEYVFEFSHD